MDPNATLARMRELIADVGNREGIYDLIEITECAEALDDWLSRGGFLPAAWHPHLSDSNRKRVRA